MRVGLTPIEQVIQPDGGASEVGGMAHAKADHVMERIVSMGIGAHGHAAAAIGTDFGPVCITAFGIDLPAQGAVRMGFPVPGGDGLGGAHRRALGAPLAEIDHGRVPGGLINLQGQVRGDDGQAHPGA